MDKQTTLQDAIETSRKIISNMNFIEARKPLSLVLSAAEKQMQDGPKAERLLIIEWFWKNEWNGLPGRGYTLDYVDKHWGQIAERYQAAREGK